MFSLHNARLKKVAPSNICSKEIIYSDLKYNIYIVPAFLRWAAVMRASTTLNGAVYNWPFYLQMTYLTKFFHKRQLSSYSSHFIDGIQFTCLQQTFSSFPQAPKFPPKDKACQNHCWQGGQYRSFSREKCVQTDDLPAFDDAEAQPPPYFHGTHTVRTHH